MNDTMQIMITMVCYMLAVIAIGFVFARRANRSSEDYFLGGRSLGPWVTAMSAEASDMSGWLLMGLPGVAYWCGVADASWTAIGLAVGTYVNWLITSKRLRRYSEKAGNAITLPEFFSNRFHEQGKVVMTIAALFILIFFTVYASSCLVTCGKLFSTLFGFDYVPMMIVGAGLRAAVHHHRRLPRRERERLHAGGRHDYRPRRRGRRGLHKRGRRGRRHCEREADTRLPRILRHGHARHRRRRRPGRGGRRTAVRREGRLQRRDHPLRPRLGPRLLRYAPGAAALHGHPRGSASSPAAAASPPSGCS